MIITIITISGKLSSYNLLGFPVIDIKGVNAL